MWFNCPFFGAPPFLRYLDNVLCIRLEYLILACWIATWEDKHIVIKRIQGHPLQEGKWIQPFKLCERRHFDLNTHLCEKLCAVKVWQLRKKFSFIWWRYLHGWLKTLPIPCESIALHVRTDYSHFYPLLFAAKNDSQPWTCHINYNVFIWTNGKHYCLVKILAVEAWSWPLKDTWSVSGIYEYTRADKYLDMAPFHGLAMMVLGDIHVLKLIARSCR